LLIGVLLIDLQKGAGKLVFPWRRGFAGFDGDGQLTKGEALAGIAAEGFGAAAALVDGGDFNHALGIGRDACGPR
jgi:hypothetical protein